MDFGTQPFQKELEEVRILLQDRLSLFNDPELSNDSLLRDIAIINDKIRKILMV